MSTDQYELEPTTVGFVVVSTSSLGREGPMGPRGTSATPGTEVTDPVVTPQGELSYTYVTHWGINAEGDPYWEDDPNQIPENEKAFWDPSRNAVISGKPGTDVVEIPSASDVVPLPTSTGPGGPGFGFDYAREGHFHQIGPHAGTHMPGGTDEIDFTQVGLGDYVEGSDPRLSDARTPVEHAESHALAGDDPIEASAIGALQANMNLSDVPVPATARANLGLGSAATQATGAFDASGAASTALSAAQSYADSRYDELYDLFPVLHGSGTALPPYASVPTGTLFHLTVTNELYRAGLAGWVLWFGGDTSDRLLPNGEMTMERNGGLNTNQAGANDQMMKLTYFTAARSETISKVRVAVGAVASAGTPTRAQMAVWEADDAGALTLLVASTPNDNTTLFGGSTNSIRTKSFSAPFNKVRGRRYACGLLMVTASTAPQFLGASYSSVAGLSGLDQRSGGQYATSTLPATVVAGSVADTTSVVHFELLQ
jgi:hypothetical protein